MADQNFRVKRGLEVGIGGTVITTTASGSVGIGTTNPGATLDARGKTLLWNRPNVGYAATKGDMDTYAVLKLRGHATDSTNMQFAHIGNGNAMGIQVTNALNTANWDILLNPFGGNVGIGTTNPLAKLQIGNGNSNGGFDDTTNPLLSVGGSIVDSTTYIRIGKRITTTESNLPFITHGSWNNAGNDLILGAHSTTGRIRFFTGLSTSDPMTGSNVERFTINQSGSVGIGTTNPLGTLQVNSGTSAVVVSAAGSVGIGTTNPTQFLDINKDTNGATDVVIRNNNTGTSAFTSFSLVNDGSSIGLQNNALSRTVSRFGSAVGGWGEILLSSGNGIKLGTTIASPVVLGTNNTEALRIDSSQRVGIGTTNPTEKLQVFGESNIANRTSYFSAPGDLFSFPGTENDIQFPGQNYEIITVGVASDIASNLNNKYFTIYGPGGTSSAIDVTAAEQNVVIWFNVAGAGSTPAVVGAGRSVGIAITSGASAISVGNSITTQMSSDAGFTVATSGDGNVVFVPKTPQNFSAPTVGTAGTVGFAVATTQDGSGILSGTGKWAGGVLAPNGKIYGIPINSTSVLVIDPATGITTTFGSLSGSSKWNGGVLAPNGKIYGIPYTSTSVLVIDPATNTTSTFGSLSGSSKWIGGVLAPNGKIYGIPFSSTTVLVIDPAVGTATTFGSLSGSNKWYGGVLSPNGKIYGIPYTSTTVLVIDPATNTTSTFGSLSGTSKWVGGVFAPNGKIYAIPYDSTSVLVIDPATNTTSTFGSLSGTGKWFGGVLAPNGKIYGIPANSTSVLVIDPAVGTATTFGSLSGSFKWVGGVLAPNGKIYGIPYSSTSVLSIGGGSAAIPDWYLSAYQNKF